MRHVMLVDDDDLVRTLIAHRLMENDWRVTVLKHDQDLERMLSDEPADLLIISLGLPHCDGFSVLERLRSQGINIPAFILTLYDLPHLKDKARSAGVADLLQKPFKEEELLAKAEALMAA